MEIKTTKKLENIIADLYGEIDQSCIQRIKDVLQAELMTRGARNLIINLRNVTFMDSSGIGLILGRYKYLKSSGGKLVLCGAGIHARRILTVSGVAGIVPIKRNVDEALKYLKEEKNK